MHILNPTNHTQYMWSYAAFNIEIQSRDYKLQTPLPLPSVRGLSCTIKHTANHKSQTSQEIIHIVVNAEHHRQETL